MKKAKKIALVGPESSGKSQLAASLAAQFDTAWVREYARVYLNKLNRAYEQSDLLLIAEGQIQSEKAQLLNAQNGYLFCDTNLMVIQIWSEYRYGHCDTRISKMAELQSYDLHLLCAPDLPWEADPLREHPEQRWQLFELYEAALKQKNLDYVVVRGLGERRLREAVAAVSGRKLKP